MGPHDPSQRQVERIDRTISVEVKTAGTYGRPFLALVGAHVSGRAIANPHVRGLGIVDDPLLTFEISVHIAGKSVTIGRIDTERTRQHVHLEASAR